MREQGNMEEVVEVGMGLGLQLRELPEVQELLEVLVDRHILGILWVRGNRGGLGFHRIL